MNFTSVARCVECRSGRQPSPSPTASPAPWDTCDDTGSLPWDRFLGLKMRVLDGPDFDLVAYRGKAVMINVFATWCGPSNAEMPHVVEAANDFQARGFTVIGVDDREPDDTVRAFRKQHAIPFPIAMDGNGGLVRALEVGNESATVYRIAHFLDAVDAAKAGKQ